MLSQFVSEYRAYLEALAEGWLAVGAQAVVILDAEGQMVWQHVPAGQPSIGAGAAPLNGDAAPLVVQGQRVGILAIVGYPKGLSAGAAAQLRSQAQLLSLCLELHVARLTAQSDLEHAQAVLHSLRRLGQAFRDSAGIEAFLASIAFEAAELLGGEETFAALVSSATTTWAFYPPDQSYLSWLQSLPARISSPGQLLVARDPVAVHELLPSAPPDVRRLFVASVAVGEEARMFLGVIDKGGMAGFAEREEQGLTILAETAAGFLAAVGGPSDRARSRARRPSRRSKGTTRSRKPG